MSVIFSFLDIFLWLQKALWPNWLDLLRTFQKNLGQWPKIQLQSRKVDFAPSMLRKNVYSLLRKNHALMSAGAFPSFRNDSWFIWSSFAADEKENKSARHPFLRQQAQLSACPGQKCELWTWNIFQAFHTKHLNMSVAGDTLLLT